MEPSADAANTSDLLSRSGSSIYTNLKTYYQECIASFRKKESGRTSALSLRRTRILLTWLENTWNLKTLWPNASCLWLKQQNLRAERSPAVLFFPSIAVWESQRHMWERNSYKKERRREKSLSSYQLVCLLLPFLFQTTGCLELIHLGPNPLQLSHRFGKLSLCCVAWCAFGLLYLLVR